jgi:hypothetical protein
MAMGKFGSVGVVGAESRTAFEYGKVLLAAPTGVVEVMGGVKVDFFLYLDGGFHESLTGFEV